MSDEIFPVLPGQTWPRAKSPRTSTSVRRANGRRFALSQQLYPTYLYRIPYGYLRKADLDTLAGFFKARRGRLDDFLFDDRDDNTAAAQAFGVGDGSTTAFQLVRALGGFAEPVRAFAGAPAIAVNGATVNLLAPYGGFEVDTNSDGLADGWTDYNAGTTGTISRGMVAGGTGAFFQRNNATALGATTSDQVGVRGTAYAPVSAGDQYTLAADVSINSGITAKLGLAVGWFTAATSFLSLSSDTTQSLAPGLTRKSATFTAPAGAAKALAYVYTHSKTAGAGLSFDVDNAMLQAGAAATAFNDNACTVSSTGLVTFAPAPSAAAALTWSGGYYWRCAFLKDEQEFEEFMRLLYTTRAVEFESFHP